MTYPTTYQKQPGQLDERDTEILANRMRERMAITKPLQGDWVRNRRTGRMLRISHVWDFPIRNDDSDIPAKVQLSTGGSWYLENSGHGSFSGSLYGGPRLDEMHDTGEVKEASFWFFSHGWAGASRGVYFDTPVRVWEYDGEDYR